MVEMVLLVLSSRLDHLWPCDISGGWSGSTDWDSRGAEQACESVPKGRLWIWVQLPWSCCRCSRWICAPLLVCLCLWHQVSQLPETVIKQVLNYGLGVQAVSFWKKNEVQRKLLSLWFWGFLSPVLKLVTIHIISLVYKMYQNSFVSVLKYMKGMITNRAFVNYKGHRNLSYWWKVNKKTWLQWSYRHHGPIPSKWGWKSATLLEVELRIWLHRFFTAASAINPRLFGLQMSIGGFITIHLEEWAMPINSVKETADKL